MGSAPLDRSSRCRSSESSTKPRVARYGALLRSAVRPVVGVAVAAAMVVTAGAPAGAASPTMFGASGSSRELIQTNERLAGHAVHGARVFKSWDSALFAADQRWARDTGHTLFLSIKSARRSGGAVKWSAIASAQPGSALYKDMQRQASEIKSFGDKTYIAFNHEPEASPELGSPAEFVAAWRKLVSVYRAEGVRNAEYVWTMTAWGFVRKDGRRAELYYPGDAYVDHIAADGYNWYQCRTSSGRWTELADIIEGQRQFGKKHPGKSLMIWESGSAEDVSQPGRKAQWLRNARSLFKQTGYEQYSVVLTWEGRKNATARCGFDFNSSSSAKQAWAEFTTDPAYSTSVVS